MTGKRLNSCEEMPEHSGWHVFAFERCRGFWSAFASCFACFVSTPIPTLQEMRPCAHGGFTEHQRTAELMRLIARKAPHAPGDPWGSRGSPWAPMRAELAANAKRSCVAAYTRLSIIKR